MPKRLNIQLKPDIDKMLRDISLDTQLKLITIISNGIKSEYVKWRERK